MRARTVDVGSRALVLAILAAWMPACVLPGAELVEGGAGGEGPGPTMTTGTGTTSSGGGDPASTASSASSGGEGGHGGQGGGQGGHGGQGGDGGAGGEGGQGGAGGDGGGGGAGGEGGGGGAQPLSPPVALDVGLGHACVVHEDGAVSCWGRNDQAQVGFDTAPLLQAWAPDVVGGLPGEARAIALGDRHGCALVATAAAETRVYCWGDDAEGQTGGNGASQPTKIEYPNTADVEDVAEIAAGWHFACARLAIGDVVCWGDGGQGALGTVGASDSARAAMVTLGDDAIDLDASPAASRACAVLVGGVLQCWGDGAGVETVPGTTGATRVAVGAVATSAPAASELVFVIDDGRVMWTRRVAGAWVEFSGLGQFGEDYADARQVEVGQHEVCVVDVDGGLRCATYDGSGLPDDGTLAVVDVGGAVAEIALGSAGVGHDGAQDAVRCARLVDGRVRCQGSNVEGTVGNGAALVEPIPVAVPGLDDVRRLALSSTATVAFEGDEAIPSGSGTSTVLGIEDAIVPTTTLLPPGLDAFAFGNPGGTEAYAHGVDVGLQLRLGPVLSATRLVALPHGFVDGLAASTRDVGRTDGGGVVTLCRSSSCDDFGGMGNGAAGATTGTSVEIAVGLAVEEVLGGPSAGHHCVIGTAPGGARRLACWGRSQAGQVGAGAAVVVDAPATVIANDVVDACVQGTRTCAVAGPDGDRDVLCWGSAGNGGHPAAPTTPTVLAGTQGAAGVTCGASFTCAWFDDGSARCWGANDRGQLGDGTLEPHDTPEEVLALDGVAEIVAGTAHACAIHDGGTVSCWGRNEVGQLGIGVPLRYDAPVDVLLGGGP